jgi:hypothetical protein
MRERVAVKGLLGDETPMGCAGLRDRWAAKGLPAVAGCKNWLGGDAGGDATLGTKDDRGLP